MAWKSFRADSWASSVVWLALVVFLGAVGARVGPRLRKFPDGHPFVQELLAARHGQALAFTHFMPGRCMHHWGIMRGTFPVVTAVPVFLGGLSDNVADGVRLLSVQFFKDEFFSGVSNNYHPKYNK